MTPLRWIAPLLITFSPCLCMGQYPTDLPCPDGGHPVYSHNSPQPVPYAPPAEYSYSDPCTTSPCAPTSCAPVTCAPTSCAPCQPSYPYESPVQRAPVQQAPVAPQQMVIPRTVMVPRTVSMPMTQMVPRMIMVPETVMVQQQVFDQQTIFQRLPAGVAVGELPPAVGQLPPANVGVFGAPVVSNADLITALRTLAAATPAQQSPTPSRAPVNTDCCEELKDRLDRLESKVDKLNELLQKHDKKLNP